MFAAYENCTLCPRMCGIDRNSGVGVCGASAVVRAGRAALHWWEEPCLVGDRGSGTVFFSHCPMGCIYCQNYDLAAGEGVDISMQDLRRAMLLLQDEQNAANINLVTGTHYVPTIIAALEPLKASGALHVPVVWNTSGYERVETLRQLAGLVDVYLVDYKYAFPDTARELSRAGDYPQVALAAIGEMLQQQPKWVEGENGLLQRGVIVRHLILPGHVDESLAALDVLNSMFGPSIRLSIMNQYTPVGGGALRHHGLDRTVTAEEYERVLDYADMLGFEDYFWQEGGAAQESFIPAFDGTGLIGAIR